MRMLPFSIFCALPSVVFSMLPSASLLFALDAHLRVCRSTRKDTQILVARHVSVGQLFYEVPAHVFGKAGFRTLASDHASRLAFVPLQVHISHIGQMVFKGVAEPQTVMQISTAHLAARQFPPEPPSAKAELVRHLFLL